MSKRINILYASTSGHTEYVCTHLAEYIAKKTRSLNVQCTRIELATEKHLHDCDVVVLAASSWNTGGIEGQLNPYMHRFVHAVVPTVDLHMKPVAIIGCGDERYFYTCKAADHLIEFVKTHNGMQLNPELRIINEPYHQHNIIEAWADTFIDSVKSFRFPRKK